MSNEQTKIKEWQDTILAIIRQKFGEVPEDVEDIVYRMKEWSGTKSLVGLLPALLTIEDIRGFLNHDIKTYNLLNG